MDIKKWLSNQQGFGVETFHTELTGIEICHSRVVDAISNFQLTADEGTESFKENFDRLIAFIKRMIERIKTFFKTIWDKVMERRSSLSQELFSTANRLSSLKPLTGSTPVTVKANNKYLFVGDKLALLKNDTFQHRVLTPGSGGFRHCQIANGIIGLIFSSNDDIERNVSENNFNRHYSWTSSAIRELWNMYDTYSDNSKNAGGWAITSHDPALLKTTAKHGHGDNSELSIDELSRRLNETEVIYNGIAFTNQPLTISEDYTFSSERNLTSCIKNTIPQIKWLADELNDSVAHYKERERYGRRGLERLLKVAERSEKQDSINYLHAILQLKSKAYTIASRAIYVEGMVQSQIARGYLAVAEIIERAHVSVGFKSNTLGS